MFLNSLKKHKCKSNINPNSFNFFKNLVVKNNTLKESISINYVRTIIGKIPEQYNSRNTNKNLTNFIRHKNSNDNFNIKINYNYNLLIKFNKKFYLNMEATKKEEPKFNFVRDETDPCKDNYGVLPIIVSSTDPENRFKTQWSEIKDISDTNEGQKIKMRVRLQRSRIKGAGGFVVLRQKFYTCQGVIFSDEVISKQMIKFIGTIPLESIVDIEGEVVKVKQPIESCTLKTAEIKLNKFFLVVESTNILPFQMEDANRKGNPEEEDDECGAPQQETQVPVEEKKEENASSTDDASSAAAKGKKDKKKEKAEKKEKEKAEKNEKKEIVVKIKTRLDNRTLDLRVPATQAAFRIQSGVGQLFTEYLYKNNFTEIHTPKIIGGASEGGTNVFKMKYFDSEACLAQSPQLYKQMAIIGDMERVMEIGPVFRAENSNTGRHLCEFTGLDFEMEIKEHFFEVLDILGGLFYYIFEGINTRYANEMSIINAQYPFEPLKLSKEVLKLDFKEGIKMLHDAGVEQDINEDLSTDTEKALGKLVFQKYETDFYILYGYPKNARPFYTMPDPKDENFTNSFDAFIRGEEVVSGAQRIHVYDMLLQKVKDKGINPDTLKDYLNSFKLGAPAHGGAGIGLERVVKYITGIKNIKKTSMFPRDPKRLTP
jgi:nondiscriminating aspartyl-tRNA synthetase